MTKLYIRQNLHLPDLASLAAEPGILPGFIAWIDGYGRYTSAPSNTFIADGYHVVVGNGVQWVSDSVLTLNPSQIDGYTISLIYSPQYYTAPIDNVIGEHISKIDLKLGSIINGNIIGPVSATDNAIVRFDTASGKLVQNSLVIVTDTGQISNLTTPTLASDAVTKGYVDGYFVTNLSSAIPAAEVVGGSGTAGVAPTSSKSDHIHPLPAFGTTSGTFAQGNDSRLSDARIPTVHAGTHIAGGSDVIDGYHLVLSYSPLNYSIPVDGYIGEHIAGIDGALEDFVVGPVSATDNAIARFNLTTGTIIQNSLVTITDTGIISNVTTPVSASDAVTKGYVDGYFVTNLASTTPAAVGTSGVVGVDTKASHSDHVHALTFATANSVIGTANASISVNNQNITNLLSPILSTDAVNKGYLDGYKKTTTVEFALTENVSNTTAYFFTWRSTGGDTSTGKRSSSATGIQNANGASPYQVPFNATIVKALLTVRGVGVQNGTVTYPVSYRTNIMDVGFTSETSLGDLDFSISNVYAVGTYAVGATNFKGSSTLSINVNEGDMLGLRFINRTGASVAGLTRMAFVTLVLEAR